MPSFVWNLVAISLVFKLVKWPSQGVAQIALNSWYLVTLVLFIAQISLASFYGHQMHFRVPYSFIYMKYIIKKLESYWNSHGRRIHALFAPCFAKGVAKPTSLISSLIWNQNGHVLSRAIPTPSIEHVVVNRWPFGTGMTSWTIPIIVQHLPNIQ